ncbi:MAG: L-lactate permease [Clostridia bacterium]
MFSLKIGNKIKKLIYSVNILGMVLALVVFIKSLNSGDSWYQIYTPVNESLLLSTLVALLPAVSIFCLLIFMKRSAFVSSVSALLVALALSVFVWKMPLRLALSSTLLGMATGLFPIIWTLSSAVWIFNMLVESGYFEVIMESLKRVSYDRRIQTLLIGFAFICLLESLAAFGAPIAIGVSMLTGLGFPPVMSATIALLADTSPSAWGTQGMPLMILNTVTGIDINRLGMIIGRQTPLISALIPVGLVFIMSGWEGLKGVWLFAMAVGLAYAIGAFVTSNFLTPLAVGIVGALASIVVILIILKFWQPKHVWTFNGDSEFEPKEDRPKLSISSIIKAWSPYILLVLAISLINGTGLKNILEKLSTIRWEWFGLHKVVMKTAPVVPSSEPYSAVFQHSILTSGGTIVFMVALVTIILLNLPIKTALKIYVRTLRDLLFPGLTIVCILGIAYLMNYSGMTYTIGLLFASSNMLFPFATVFLGLFGCSLGGSVAGSNALFGNLVVVAGRQIGVDPAFSAATLCSGGTMGKSLTPQNLVIANSVLKIEGLEGKLIGKVIGFTLIYATILGVWAMIQYHMLPWLI